MSASRTSPRSATPICTAPRRLRAGRLGTLRKRPGNALPASGQQYDLSLTARVIAIDGGVLIDGGPRSAGTATSRSRRLVGPAHPRRTRPALILVPGPTSGDMRMAQQLIEQWEAGRTAVPARPVGAHGRGRERTRGLRLRCRAEPLGALRLVGVLRPQFRCQATASAQGAGRPAAASAASLQGDLLHGEAALWLRLVRPTATSAPSPGRTWSMPSGCRCSGCRTGCRYRPSWAGSGRWPSRSTPRAGTGGGARPGPVHRRAGPTRR